LLHLYLVGNLTSIDGRPQSHDQTVTNTVIHSTVMPVGSLD